MSPKLKSLLDYGPLVVFLAVFLLYRNETVTLWGQGYPGLILATLVFVPLTVAANWILWARTGALSVMQLVTLAVDMSSASAAALNPLRSTTVTNTRMASRVSIYFQ